MRVFEQFVMVAVAAFKVVVVVENLHLSRCTTPINRAILPFLHQRNWDLDSRFLNCVCSNGFCFSQSYFCLSVCVCACFFGIPVNNNNNYKTTSFGKISPLTTVDNLQCGWSTFLQRYRDIRLRRHHRTATQIQELEIWQCSDQSNDALLGDVLTFAESQLSQICESSAGM